MLSFLKLLGVITAVVITGILIFLNSTPVHIDLFFTKGDTAVFLVIMTSFILGFISCYILIEVRNIKKNKKKTATKLKKENRLIGEI